MSIGPSGGETGVEVPLGDGHDLRPGSVIADRYLVEEELGSGGMAIVLRVTDRKMEGAQCALKVLKPELLQELDPADAESVLRRFKQEVLLVRDRLQHTNIVRIFDYHDVGHLHFASMELVRGRSLDDELARGGPELGPDEIRSILFQLTQALASAHDRGVVHRDLKPANLLMFQSAGRWVVKLCDFGIAKVIEGTPLVTGTGAAPLTPRYAAPEQRGGDPVGTWTDVYQLGLVAYQLVNQDPDRHWADDQANANLSFPPWLPDGVAKLIHRCLEPDPNQRFPNGAALLSALKTAWVAGRASVLTRLLPWLGLGAVLVAVLVTLWALNQRPDRPTSPSEELPTAVAELPTAPGQSDGEPTVIRPTSAPPRPTSPPDRPPGNQTPQPTPSHPWQAALAEDLLNLLSPARLKLGTTSNRTVYHAGETVAFQVTADRPGYLYLLVFSENNVATCIFPSDQDRSNWISSGSHTIPRNNDYEFPVQEPFGNDLVVAILAPRQLNLGDRVTFGWQEVFDRLQVARVKEVLRTRGIGVRPKPTVVPELRWQTAVCSLSTKAM